MGSRQIQSLRKAKPLTELADETQIAVPRDTFEIPLTRSRFCSMIFCFPCLFYCNSILFSLAFCHPIFLVKGIFLSSISATCSPCLP